MTEHNVVPFVPRHGGKTYRPVFMLFEGYKRRQWAVVEREPDGTETYRRVSRGRKSEAFAMVNLWKEVKARHKRDMERLARDPIGKAALALTPDQRELMIKVLSVVQRMTG